MNNRTITVGALAAVLIVGLWWMFVFSGIRSESSDVSEQIDAARGETRSLDTELKLLEDLEARAPETQAELDRLRQAVPDDAELASFIDAANALGSETGVTWLSVAPTAPAAGTAAGTIPLAISVEGGYFQVLDYLNRLEDLSRLVVVDSVSLDAAESAEASASGAPTLTATLTARMFSQPAAASAAAGDATTPTSVAGGGGVAATPSGQET